MSERPLEVQNVRWRVKALLSGSAIYQPKPQIEKFYSLRNDEIKILIPQSQEDVVLFLRRGLYFGTLQLTSLRLGHHTLRFSQPFHATSIGKKSQYLHPQRPFTFTFLILISNDEHYFSPSIGSFTPFPIPLFHLIYTFVPLASIHTYFLESLAAVLAPSVAPVTTLETYCAALATCSLAASKYSPAVSPKVARSFCNCACSS